MSSHQSEALSGWALLSICTSRPSIHFLFPHLPWPPIPPQTLVGEAPCDGGQAFFICQQLEPWGPGILRPPDARAWSPEAMSEPTVSQWLLLAVGYHFPFVSDGQTDRQTMGPERSLLQSHLILSEIARILILQFFPLIFFLVAVFQYLPCDTLVRHE